MHYLSDYQTFKDTQELNHHVKQHEQMNAAELNATDRSILRFIARYSVKYSGASHLKVATIAEAMNKSERTIGRVLKRLEALNIIRRIGTIRPKSGGKGASIIQILPFDSTLMSERMSDSEVTEKATEPTVKRQLSENEPLRKQYKNNYVLETGIDAPKAVKNAIPAPIYDVLSPFFSARELTRLTGVIFRGKTAKVRIEDHEEAFTTVILDCIRRYKNGAITSLDGYLYTSIRRLSRRLFLQEVSV